jgi:xanthine dehydrogenase accessory factor
VDKNVHLAKVINTQLQANLPLVLVSLVSQQGSAPRHDGTKMVVTVDGKTFGTIGGSLIEAAAIKESRAAIMSQQSKILSYELSGKDTTSPDMICGGKAEIFLDYISPSATSREFAVKWLEAISRGKDLFILTAFKNSGQSMNVEGYVIIDAECRIISGSVLTESDVSMIKTELHTITTTSIFSLGETSVMVDRIRKLKTLYCFGAGHVAVPTAHLASLVGFKVIILDDRPEYSNTARFPDADKTLVVKDFIHALDGLEIDNDSYIIIVTRGHQYDRQVLEQSLKTSAGYIGMISSKRKRAAIFEALMAEGVTKQRLDWVHSPIGLDIDAETPEEIAVSIVAELIQVRNQQTA